MPIEDTLNLNSYLKFLEFVLHSIDGADDAGTLATIRYSFKEKFGIEMPRFMSQHFGLLRLIPLMHMVEENFLIGTDDGLKIKAIRNAFAHNTFSCNQTGYAFFSE